MTFKPFEHIQRILASLPTKPGCYIMPQRCIRINQMYSIQ